MQKGDVKKLIIVAVEMILFTAAVAGILIALRDVGLAEGEEPVYSRMYVICRPDGYVNIRALPKKKSEAVGWLDCGEEVLTMGEQKGPYLKIYKSSIEAAEGWVHTGYLTEGTVEAWPEGKKFTVEATGRVALRRTVNGPRRAWVKPGKRLTVYAASAEWALTNRGFIMREYLEEAEE